MVALWLLLLCWTVLPGNAIASDEFDIPAHYTKYEYRIPMRDGVQLFTAVYVPADTTKKYPILMTRTPYGIAPYGPGKFPERIGPSRKFEEDGYIFVHQDVRGRFMSEGVWSEMTPEKNVHRGPHDVDESTDAYDTVDWLVKNIPNNNGKVGMIGISYPGFYASASLIDAHPALVAVSPQAPVSDLYMGDDSFHNGAFFLMANFDFYTGFNKQNNPQLPTEEPEFNYGTNDGYQFFLNLGPLMNANEKYLHFKNPYWTDVVDHTNYDAFWQSRSILPHLRNIKPAVLVVGGWYDAEDLSGTLKTFRAIEHQSPVTTVHLVMGPWWHGGWANAAGDRLGDITFGANTAEFFRDHIELPFFQHYLKGASDPNLPKAYVFETGQNQWHREDQWPPSDVRPRRFYLEDKGSLANDPPAASIGYDEYTSDPAHPVPFVNKPTIDVTRKYMDGDQRFAGERPDVLTYETGPLQQDATISGPVSASLFVSTSGTDSDFDVKLIDVYPAKQNTKAAADDLSGYQQLVRGEPFRGKFREGFVHPVPFTPGKMQQIRFTMPDVDHCFRKGHRIMVQVQSSWFPLTDRNPQTFTNIPTAKPADFRKATERIYRAKNAASFLEVDMAPNGDSPLSSGHNAR
jgi:putative CocE/NonD family hydrolase